LLKYVLRANNLNTMGNHMEALWNQDGKRSRHLQKKNNNNNNNNIKVNIKQKHFKVTGKNWNLSML